MKKISFLLFLYAFSFHLHGNYKLHQTKKGESYYSIGRSYGVDYRKLLKINQGKKLYAGSTIKIPLHRQYRVEKGDNFYRLSKKFRIPVKELSLQNGGMRELRVGEWIQIPSFTKKKSKHSPQLEKREQPKASKQAVVKKSPLLNKKFVWPASGMIAEQYGKDGAFMNYGLLLKLRGRNVVSMEQGRVQYVGELRGFGKTILVDHGENCVSLYAGLDKTSLVLHDIVKRGQKIALGNNELFFSIYIEGSPENPLRYMGKR